MNNIVIYTAITNNYDTLPVVKCVDPYLDYVCFTDNPHLKSDVWKIVLLPGKEKREDKKVKILPHRYFENYDISIWVDANYILYKNLHNFVDIALKYYDHAVFKHHANRTNLEKEVNICIKYRKENSQKLKDQLKDYRQEFKDTTFEIVHNAIIVRRHNKEKVKTVMEEWWKEIQKWTMRDQISFPYIAYKYNYQYDVLNMSSLKNNWFERTKHERRKR
ncbi:MAG: glycosyltransferase domain-containing protein [Bacteroidales bacterium]